MVHDWNIKIEEQSIMGQGESIGGETIRGAGTTSHYCYYHHKSAQNNALEALLGSLKSRDDCELLPL